MLGTLTGRGKGDGVHRSGAVADEKKRKNHSEGWGGLSMAQKGPKASQQMIFDYLKRYQEDPSSRVFAPLSEAYRKAGLVDEAIQIAKEGLRVHPQFIGGRVALARAYFDQKKYEQVIAELLPILQDIPDNLIAQRLLADSFLMLGRVAEALSALKLILYFNPADRETAVMVQELESQSFQQGGLVLKDPLPRSQSWAQQGGPATADWSEGGFGILPAGQAMAQDPERLRHEKVRQVEFLQTLLQRVERYRMQRGFEGERKAGEKSSKIP